MALSRKRALLRMKNRAGTSGFVRGPCLRPDAQTLQQAAFLFTVRFRLTAKQTVQDPAGLLPNRACTLLPGGLVFFLRSAAGGRFDLNIGTMTGAGLGANRDGNGF